MNHCLELTIQREPACGPTPSDEEFSNWVSAALKDSDTPVSVNIRVLDTAESAALNEHYRKRSGATNVLSFVAELPLEVLDGLEYRPLGDLAICAPLVVEEALDQGKTANDHWAHLTVHGVLHLLGYDHVEETQAEIMESHERTILGELGIRDPYLGSD